MRGSDTGSRGPAPGATASITPSPQDEASPAERNPSVTGAVAVVGITGASAVLIFAAVYALQRAPAGRPVATVLCLAIIVAVAIGARTLAHGDRPEAPGWIRWDAAGLVGAGSSLALLAFALVEATPIGEPGLGPLTYSVILVGLVGISLSVAAVRVLTRAEDLPARSVARALIRPWTLPARPPEERDEGGPDLFGGGTERPRSSLTLGLPSLLGGSLLAVIWALQSIPGGPFWSLALVGAILAFALVAIRRNVIPPDPAGVWWLHSDVLGFTGSTSAALLLTALLVEAAGMAPHRAQIAVGMVLVGGLGLTTTAAAGVLIARRRRLPAGALARALVRVWSDPVDDWVVFVLGAVVALPLFAFLGQVLFDPDSARIVASVLDVQRHGIGFLTRSQEVLLPHLVLGPALVLGGIPAAITVSILSTQILSGVVSFITWKLTRNTVAAVAVVLVLLASRTAWERATLLPMYSAMLALGYGAAYLALLAMRRAGRDRWVPTVLSSLLLVLAAEAHDVGKLFLVVPALLLLVEPTKRAARTMALIYLSSALFFIPRIAINLASGGLSQFTVNRVDWFVQHGYLRSVNAVFRRYPTRGTPIRFLGRLLAETGHEWSWRLAVPLVLATLALLASRWRARLLGVTATALLLALILKTSPPPFPRYLSPVIPGGAIAAAVGLTVLARGAAVWRKVLAAIVPVILLVGTASAFNAAAHDVRAQRAGVLRSGIQLIAQRIDDGKRVMGVRPHRLTLVSTDVDILLTPFFDEQEFVTFLTWPSDRAVLDMMRGHDIGWVLVLRNKRLETDYHNTWLIPTYGIPDRHVQALEQSPNFCRIAEVREYLLYRVGPCGA